MLKQQTAKEHFIYVILLLVIAVLAFWQLSFLKYSVTHDMINCWIPWRHFISEALQNHQFPFWDPYQQLGYPIHADLQGPTWYLESLILGSTIGESNYVVQLLFVFYVFLAGVGMYLFSLCFHENKNSAFITGVCYMLSGFFVAHVQHFYAVIGAAWLPFILLNFYKLQTTGSYRYAIYAAIFLFFNLTGGNHTFTFILAYLFAAIALYFIYAAWKEKKKELVYRLLKLNAVFIGLTAALSSVLIVIFFQVKPYVDRLSGMDYKAASVNPLSPQSLLSLLLPFSTVNGTEFYNTDPSMCNVYIGIVLLPFILLALIRSKTGFEKLLLIFATICLLASFGAYTPVHKILFTFFPFMDLFRFPSYFSLFTWIILLLLGGKQLAFTLSSFTISKDKLIRITLALIVGILVLVVVAFSKNGGADFFFLANHQSVFEFIQGANLKQNMIYQGFIQLGLLGGLLAVIWKAPERYRLKVITLFVVADMILSVQLNIAYVGFSQTDPKELHHYIASLPKGFPVPEMNNIIENTEEKGQKAGLYRNTSVFHKRISADVFNSFCFTNQAMMLDSLRPLYDSMRCNPLVYFSDAVFPESSFRRKTISVNINPSTIILRDSDYQRISPQLKFHPSERNDAWIASFQPHQIVVGGIVQSPQLLILLQNNYVGWKAYIDGRETELFLSNYMTMSVFFPPGQHEVEFVYKNTPVVIGGLISYSVFGILLMALSILWIKESKQYILVACIWIVLLGASAQFFFG